MSIRKKVIATDYEAWNDPKFGFRAALLSTAVSVVVYLLVLNPDFGSVDFVAYLQTFFLALVGITIFAVIDERRGAPE